MKLSIRTIADLRAHCRVDEDTGCWHWLGGKRDHVTVWLSARETSTSLGAAICWLLRAHAPEPHEVWRASCGNLRCANPAHRKPIPRRIHGSMIEHTIAQAIAAAAAKRAKSRINDADVAAIRDSTEPLRLLAERYRISAAYASKVRRGECRRERAVPASSVFSWSGRIPMR